MGKMVTADARAGGAGPDRAPRQTDRCRGRGVHDLLLQHAAPGQRHRAGREGLKEIIEDARIEDRNHFEAAESHQKETEREEKGRRV
jgi:hypothetical protein